MNPSSATQQASRHLEYFFNVLLSVEVAISSKNTIEAKKSRMVKIFDLYAVLNYGASVENRAACHVFLSSRGVPALPRA